MNNPDKINNSFPDQERSGAENLDILSALEESLAGMEARNPNRREGRGDIKYETLYKFVADLQSGREFVDLYSRLEDREKHVIITCLEEEARVGRLSYEFVENLRKGLYGVIINAEGEEKLNYEKQWELERELQ